MTCDRKHAKMTKEKYKIGTRKTTTYLRHSQHDKGTYDTRSKKKNQSVLDRVKTCSKTTEQFLSIDAAGSSRHLQSPRLIGLGERGGQARHAHIVIMKVLHDAHPYRGHNMVKNRSLGG